MELLSKCSRQSRKKNHCFPVVDAHVTEPFSLVSELPTPLAGQFVSPPLRTGASGHAWVSVDKQCHLHYEIIVAGLSKADDLTVNAHLHGLAEIGEMDDSSTTHKRLLTGFYGSQVHHCAHTDKPMHMQYVRREMHIQTDTR